jgi:S1-C subfamily serine protease
MVSVVMKNRLLVTGFTLVAMVCVSASTTAQSRRSVGRTVTGNAVANIPSLAPAVKKVLPGVVSLQVTAARQKPISLQLLNQRLDAGLSVTPEFDTTYAGGSGVVIDGSRGLIVTNYHLVEGARQIDVVLSDGSVLQGALVGSDPGTDIALIRAPGLGGRAVRFGDSDRLQVGDFVVAIGSPYGLQGSASFGIVSAVRRSAIGLGLFEDFIQTDAAINPGNSGGALVDLKGRMIGINTGSSGGQNAAAGIGFAIPINMVRSICAQLAEHGEVRRGTIGFLTKTLTPGAAQTLKLPTLGGALITRIIPGSAAEPTGIEVGAVIRRVNGRTVASTPEYYTQLSTIPLGQPLELSIFSKGTYRTVTLSARTMYVELPLALPRYVAPAFEGLTSGPVTPGSHGFGAIRGARVLRVETGSAAEQLGLRPNDLITKVDGFDVRNPEQFFERTAAIKSDYVVDLRRGELHAFFRVLARAQ